MFKSFKNIKELKQIIADLPDDMPAFSSDDTMEHHGTYTDKATVCIRYFAPTTRECVDAFDGVQYTYKGYSSVSPDKDGNLPADAIKGLLIL